MQGDYQIRFGAGTGNIRSRRIPQKGVLPNHEDTALVKPVVALCRQFRPGCEKGTQLRPKAAVRATGREMLDPEFAPPRPPQGRVERQAGESKVGCGCTHLAVTAAGNAVCRAFFGGFQPFYEQPLWVGCDLPFFRKVGCTSPKIPLFAHFSGLRYSWQVKQLQDQ